MKDKTAGRMLFDGALFISLYVVAIAGATCTVTGCIVVVRWLWGLV